MSTRTIAIAAGGTGGHVLPGLAVAERLRAAGHEVVWLGTRGGLEGRLVPDAGLRAEWLTIGGLRGKGLRTLAAAPWRLARAVAGAASALRRNRVDAVLGLGGYVAAPAGLAAWLTRRPLVVHEQNARAGATNRYLARLARRVLTGFPEALPGGEWVGNPVREAIAALPEPTGRFAERSGPARVLVLGGSQGARALNRHVPQALAAAGAAVGEVRHQAGEATLDEARAAYAEAGVAADVVPYIEDMAEAYARADLVIARAGALTVCELAAAGVPAVLVPLPWAADDHQTANAAVLERAGAARICPQPELEQGALAGVLPELLADRERLAEQAAAARTAARPDAADRVAAVCEEVAHG